MKKRATTGEKEKQGKIKKRITSRKTKTGEAQGRPTAGAKKMALF